MIRAALLFLVFLAGQAMAEVSIEARDGTQTFEAPPERVVTLDWALTEQLLDLGVTPVGAPELALYRDWVGEPAVPEGVADVGLRTEPNLERIAALEPDVILASDLDPAQAQTLSRIAPTVVFGAWSADHDNIAAARDIFLRLAGLFEREATARERLDGMEGRLDEIAARIDELDLPDLATVVRLNDETTVWINGDNSVPAYTLQRLGLTSEIDLPTTRWGVTQRPLADLAAVEDGVLLAIRPHMAGAAAMEGPLWQALPAVRAGRFAEVPRVWSYGGILSVERHAEVFLDALESLSE